MLANRTVWFYIMLVQRFNFAFCIKKTGILKNSNNSSEYVVDQWFCSYILTSLMLIVMVKWEGLMRLGHYHITVPYNLLEQGS